MRQLRSSALVFLVLAAPALHPRMAGAQNETARLTIPQSVGPPDGQVAAPIQLELPDGLQIGTFTAKIAFSTKTLSFVRAEVGGLGLGVGADVQSTVKTAGEETVVEVTVATPEKDGVRTPLPAGPLAQLLLKIPKGAKPETVLPLKVHVTATGTKASSPVKIETRDSSIIVSNPSIISCFFYMH